MPTIDQIKDGKHLYRCLEAYFAMYLALCRCYILAFIDSNQEIEKELRENVGEACNFTKINTPPWVFFTFFKLYKWYQIAQRTTNVVNAITEVSEYNSSKTDVVKDWHRSLLEAIETTNFAQLQKEFDSQLSNKLRFFRNSMKLFELFLLFIRASRG